MDMLFATIDHYDGLDAEIGALTSELARHNIHARTESLWNIETLPPCPVVLVAAGGYHNDLARFLATLETLAGRGFTLINPLSTIRWNADKHYLQELEAKGHAVIPTLWLEQGDAVLWDALWQKLNATRMVLKPTISAGAHETRAITQGENETDHRDWLITQLKQGAMMAQPFAPEIEQEGEWSFLYFNGALSHTVLKTAKGGDYRVQHVHGGRYTHIDQPPAQFLEDAARILADLPPHTYARIDGIQRGGKLVLMEVEMIEPYLYMLPHAAHVQRVARALAHAAGKNLSIAA
jgi:glutathione synthase/RimK-type ligase-like ATP-grasp enzyme